jgi:hypothetical protein
MDDIHARKPVNKTAALVVSGSGYVWEFNCNACHSDSDLPIPFLKFKPPHPNQKQNWTDFTGFNLGRLKVFGVCKNRPSRWVCLCNCGKYTTRTSKALAKSVAGQRIDPDCCQECNRVAEAKRLDRAKQGLVPGWRPK